VFRESKGSTEAALTIRIVATYPNARAIRKPGTLKFDQFHVVFTGLLRWLGEFSATRKLAINARVEDG
jgi:hypothetical protein